MEKQEPSISRQKKRKIDKLSKKIAYELAIIEEQLGITLFSIDWDRVPNGDSINPFGQWNLIARNEIMVRVKGANMQVDSQLYREFYDNNIDTGIKIDPVWSKIARVLWHY